jgi:large subunit ribosomal protein L15
MNGLHSLGPRPGATSKKKRVGRGPGSGIGKTSGRGHKGQKSRSGYTSLRGNEGGQMPLHRRIPKRGFQNIFRQQWATVTLAALERIFEVGASVDELALREAGAIKGRAERKVKILGTGEISKALTIKADRFTEGARKKIEAAGGRCEVVPA